MDSEIDQPTISWPLSEKSSDKLVNNQASDDITAASSTIYSISLA